MEKSDVDSDCQAEQNSWDLRSSSSGQLTDDPSQPCRKKYRSKSAVSTDPRSPYYTSRGLAGEESAKLGGRFAKAPSVSCVPNYDCSKYGDAVAQLPCHAGVAGLNLSPDDPKAATIRQHYYPEGGWGYVVCASAFLVELISVGLHAGFGLLLVAVMDVFAKEATLLRTVIFGTSSWSMSYLLCPVVVSWCCRKSPRLLSLLGGLLTSLGLLFASFASRPHQLALSWVLVVGVGLGLTRTTAHTMVGQYFKRRRDFIEIIIVSATGFGVAGIPILLAHSVRILGWRIGLQTITGLATVTILLGVFYRPVSLYHPQRRAILHLKGLQKRSKAKDKPGVPQKEKMPFIDFSVLKSRTVQILVCGTAVSALGSNAPILLLMCEGKREGLDDSSLLHLQAYLGLACILGTLSLGAIVVRNSSQCFIAKQYLMQSSVLMLAACQLAFVTLKEYSGYVLFVLVYGFFYGGYQYALKSFTFEKVRARNFSKAWGFVQCSQAIPMLLGIPLTSYLNETKGGRCGFYFASASLFVGALLLFLIDMHKRNVRRHKSAALSSRFDLDDHRGSRKSYLSTRRVTLQELASARLLAKNKLASDLLHRPELTCISEEMVVENLFDDYIDDCITSCNKEEKYLMLSEFENNLVNTQESSSVSQEVRRLAQEREKTDHCPNCFRIVTVDGAAARNKNGDCDRPNEPGSPAKKHVGSKKVNSLQNEVIDEVTSSL